MDLSQQELPLTAYFSRGNKEAKSRALPHKKDKLAEDSETVARSSKRRKSNVQCPTTSPSGSSAGQSNSRMKTRQLPTPATSTRKRTRNGRLELPARTQLTSTNVLPPVEQDATLSSMENLAQLGCGPTPSKLPQSLPDGLEFCNISPATPSTDRQTTTKSIKSHTGPQHSNQGGTGIPTPQTSSRRMSELVRGTDDHSPSARSNSHIPSKSSGATPGVFHATQHSARSITGHPSIPVDLGCPDPFYAREKNSVCATRDGTFAPPKPSSIQSMARDGPPSGGHAIPTIPVPSSQSQYLLHLDATPKRKRCSQRLERVISSQTQEERELMLPTARRLSLSSGGSPGKFTNGSTQIPPPKCSEQRSQRVYTLHPTSVGSPTNSPSRSFFATNKSSSPLQCKRSTSFHSPSYKVKTPRRPRQESIKNIPPAHIEESLTESESESDILRMRTKVEFCTLNPPSREMKYPQVRCGSVEDNFPVMEDDSATEAESDTEILHCVAEIGKKRPRNHRLEKDTPPRPVISPLVSPTRPRIATMSSIILPEREGTRHNIFESRPSYPSIMERPQLPSDSFPSVVRDFIRMFPGDESYPADFPESLRV